ncbi:MAG: hypothetical protein Kow006_33750 [Gammaproteobacteria bacterium]
MNDKTTLSVLVLTMPLMEQRIVTAALTLSHERGRSVAYTPHQSRHGRAPDIVIASCSCDRNRVAREMVKRFGPDALTRLVLIQVDGRYLLEDTQAQRTRMLTPFGLLEWLDHASRETAARSFGDSTIQMAVADLNAYREKRRLNSTREEAKGPVKRGLSTLVRRKAAPI